MCARTPWGPGVVTGSVQCDAMSIQDALAVAARQRALLTSEQCVRAGVTAEQIEWLVSSGRWEHPRERVYAIGGVAWDYERCVLAAILGAPRGTMASGPTAAYIRRYPKATIPDRIHLLTDEAWHVRLDGVVGHRSRLIVPADRTVLRGIPTTSPARVIVDCSADRELRNLCGWWMDHGLRESWFTGDDLTHTIGRMRKAPGRDLRLLRAHLVKRQGNYEPGDTQPEIRIADWLEAAGLGRPTLGAVVKVRGRNYYPDGLYEAQRVGFEYQSWIIHGAGQRTPFDADPRRMNILRTAGYDIYPFTSATTEAEAVETIGLALKLALGCNTPGRDADLG
jgi:hypothetical protein